MRAISEEIYNIFLNKLTTAWAKVPATSKSDERYVTSKALQPIGDSKMKFVNNTPPAPIKCRTQRYCSVAWYYLVGYKIQTGQ